MKNIKEFINESLKNTKIPKHNKLGGKKYKIKNKEFTQNLKNHMKDFLKNKLKIKESISEDEKETLYEITMNAISEFMSNEIDNWKIDWTSRKVAVIDL